jgi:hypothetical protein
VGGNAAVQNGNVFSVFRSDNTRALQFYVTGDNCVIDSWEASSEPLMIRSNGIGGRIVFHTSGSEKMRITPSGNIGIGVTDPDIFSRGDARMVGIGAAGASDNLALALNAGGSGGRGAQIYMGQGGTRHFTVSSNVTETRVGTTSSTPLILTTNDTARLTIAASPGDATFSSSGLFSGNLQTNGVLTIGNQSSAGNYFLQITPSTTNRVSLQGLLAGVGISDIVMQPSGGNVGIGVTPSTFLHVLGSNTSARGQLCIQSNNTSNAARASWYYHTTLQGNIGTTSGDFYVEAVNALQILTGGSQRMTLDSSGNVSIANGTFSVSQGGATRAIQISGNSCNQGAAFNYKIVRHYPVVSSGNKLIIPFTSQENLNSNTVVKVFGHSARFNARVPIAFSAYFAVGHLSVLSDLTAWGVNGNIASIGYGGGMNVEINFSSAYTSSESNGIFITIEYMTNTPSYSINVAGITMN